MADAERPARRLYGRGAGRRLSGRQKQLMETLGAELALPEGPIDPRALFPQARETRLEIGFGAGEHLAGQAGRHSDIGFIGVEFFTEGFAKALARLAEVPGGARHVRVHQGDGREVMERIADASLAVVYVLFPDPWPKTRHHKRRLIQPDTVAQFARVNDPNTFH